MSQLMHIISDDEYRAYLELTARVRDMLMDTYYLNPEQSRCPTEKVLDVSKGLDRAVKAHNKRLNSLKRAQGT